MNNMKYTNDKFTLVLFVIYTIFYETLIWGLTSSSIYYLQWQWPIIIVAIFMSSNQLKYNSFYVRVDSTSVKDSDSLSLNSDKDDLSK